MSIKISIVIVSRNEEKNIADCIKAAQKAAEKFDATEILLCDSASKDKTIEIAKSLGVKVLSLKPEWKLSASAGRYIGTHYAKGEYILFLDADTLVYEDFLPKALDFMEKNLKTAGLTGFIEDMDVHGNLLEGIERRSNDVSKLEWLRGPCCLYRRSALLEVGSFNPYLTSEEEAELGFRLMKHNWELISIPVKMAIHTRCEESYDFQSLVAHNLRGIYMGRFGGVTNTIVCAFKGGYGLAFCYSRLKTTLIFVLWLSIAGITLLLPKFFHPKYFFAIELIAGIAAVWLKKKTLNRVLVFITDKILTLVDIILGVFKIQIRNAENYPVSVDFY